MPGPVRAGRSATQSFDCGSHDFSTSPHRAQQQRQPAAVAEGASLLEVGKRLPAFTTLFSARRNNDAQVTRGGGATMPVATAETRTMTTRSYKTRAGTVGDLSGDRREAGPPARDQDRACREGRATLFLEGDRLARAARVQRGTLLKLLNTELGISVHERCCGKRHIHFAANLSNDPTSPSPGTCPRWPALFIA